MLKVGDIIVCYADIYAIGGMGFHQKYYTKGKQYEVILTAGNTHLLNEYGWYSPINDEVLKNHDYLCTLQDYRERKLKRILNA